MSARAWLAALLGLPLAAGLTALLPVFLGENWRDWLVLEALLFFPVWMLLIGMSPSFPTPGRLVWVLVVTNLLVYALVWGMGANR